MDGTIDDITFDDLTMVGDATLKTFIVDAILEQQEFTCGDRIIFQDDFSTATNWVQTGTQVTIASGEIQGWGADSTNQRLTHDLVTPLSDKSWTAEFEFEFSAFTLPAHDVFVLTDTNGPSSSLQDFISVRFGFTGALIQFGLLPSTNDLSMWIGMFDKDETFTSNQAQDSFQLAIFVDQVAKSFPVQTADNQAPRSAGTDNTMATLPSVDTFFVEMRRDSMSQTTVIFYTDNTFTTILESKNTGWSIGFRQFKVFEII